MFVWNQLLMLSSPRVGQVCVRLVGKERREGGREWMIKTVLMHHLKYGRLCCAG